MDASTSHLQQRPNEGGPHNSAMQFAAVPINEIGPAGDLSSNLSMQSRSRAQSALPKILRGRFIGIAMTSSAYRYSLLSVSTVLASL